MAYSVRKTQRNYQELADVKLPQTRRLRSQPEDQLYEVDVLEDDETGWVKGPLRRLRRGRRRVKGWEWDHFKVRAKARCAILRV